jgi:quercetin 2,3-dioxygenase
MDRIGKRIDMVEVTLKGKDSQVSASGEHERSIAKRVRGVATSDGAGVKLTRVIGTPVLRRLDPFLMLDEFRSDEPQDYLAGFPDHPHRGFETVTYMIAGSFRHRDNQGHEGHLGAGGVQWMTAGRGIVHSEMPMQEEGLVHGFQLWLNLPKKDKMIEPSYKDLQDKDVPRATLPGGVTVRVIAGKVGDVAGPIGGRVTEPLYLDVELPEGATA